MLTRLQAAIDQGARQRLAGLQPTSTFELIRKNKADTGFYLNSLWALGDLISELNERLKELQNAREAVLDGQ